MEVNPLLALICIAIEKTDPNLHGNNKCYFHGVLNVPIFVLNNTCTIVLFSGMTGSIVGPNLVSLKTARVILAHKNRYIPANAEDRHCQMQE